MTGARTFGLVPGAGGSAWYWNRVIPLLEAHGHEAIAVSLPATDDDAGFEEYADIVAHTIGERADLVLVGQSMGGFTVPLVCDRIPVAEILLVNAMIPTPGESGGEWWTATGQQRAQRELDEREGRDPDAPFDPFVRFLHDVPPDVVAEAAGENQTQSGTPFARPWPGKAWPDVPTRVIVGRDDRLFPADFQIRVARERLALDAEVIPGGHLIALSNPEGVAASLRDG